MRRPLARWLIVRGAQAAWETGRTLAPRVASATNERFTRVFEVTLPVTVFIHASSARVTVRRVEGSAVTLDANLRASFGLQFTAEQDEAGVYIVAKRKRVVGTLSAAYFTLTLPPAARLIANLTPGALLLEDLNGKVEIPPFSA